MLKRPTLGHTAEDKTQNFSIGASDSAVPHFKIIFIRENMSCFNAKCIPKVINTLVNITKLTYANLALCNNTKSQSTCMDKMSPFLLLDTAAEDQVVLLKSTRFFMALAPPLHDSVNIHRPWVPSTFLVSETQAVPATLFHPGPHSPLSLVPSLSLACGKDFHWCVCTYECTSEQVPGYQSGWCCNSGCWLTIYIRR